MVLGRGGACRSQFLGDIWCWYWNCPFLVKVHFGPMVKIYRPMTLQNMHWFSHHSVFKRHLSPVLWTPWWHGNRSQISSGDKFLLHYEFHTNESLLTNLAESPCWFSQLSQPKGHSSGPLNLSKASLPTRTFLFWKCSPFLNTQAYPPPPPSPMWVVARSVTPQLSSLKNTLAQVWSNSIWQHRVSVNPAPSASIFWTYSVRKDK